VSRLSNLSPCKPSGACRGLCFFYCCRSITRKKATHLKTLICRVTSKSRNSMIPSLLWNHWAPESFCSACQGLHALACRVCAAALSHECCASLKGPTWKLGKILLQAGSCDRCAHCLLRAHWSRGGLLAAVLSFSCSMLVLADAVEFQGKKKSWHLVGLSKKTSAWETREASNVVWKQNVDLTGSVLSLPCPFCSRHYQSRGEDPSSLLQSRKMILSSRLSCSMPSLSVSLPFAADAHNTIDSKCALGSARKTPKSRKGTPHESIVIIEPLVIFSLLFRVFVALITAGMESKRATLASISLYGEFAASK